MPLFNGLIDNLPLLIQRFLINMTKNFESDPDLTAFDVIYVGNPKYYITAVIYLNNSEKTKLMQNTGIINLKLLISPLDIGINNLGDNIIVEKVLPKILKSAVYDDDFNKDKYHILFCKTDWIIGLH